MRIANYFFKKISKIQQSGNFERKKASFLEKQTFLLARKSKNLIKWES